MKTNASTTLAAAGYRADDDVVKDKRCQPKSAETKLKISKAIKDLAAKKRAAKEALSLDQTQANTVTPVPPETASAILGETEALSISFETSPTDAFQPTAGSSTETKVGEVALDHEDPHRAEGSETGVSPAPAAKASLPFLIINAGDAELHTLGYSQETTDRMPPQEAQDILKTPAHVNRSEAPIQCATETIEEPGKAAGSPNNPDHESGIFSQIPPTDQSIPSTSHEPLESMTDERLDQFVVGHYDGLKKNTLALAEGLSEKKHRLVRKGCESGWGGWVTDTLKMSVSWADKLVRNLDVYHKFGPEVRQAAEEAGVNFAKPAVMAALRVINDEFLANGDPGILHFSACVQRLKIAGMRQQNGQVVPAGAPGKSASEGSGGGPSQTKPEPKNSDHSETKTSAGDEGHGKVQGSGNAAVLESDPYADKAHSMIEEEKQRLDEAKRRRKELDASNPVVTVGFTLADVSKDEYARYVDTLKRDPKRWDYILRGAFHEFIGTGPVKSTGNKLEILPEDAGNA